MKIRRKKSYSKDLQNLATRSMRITIPKKPNVDSATDGLGKLLLHDLCGNVSDIMLPLFVGGPQEALAQHYKDDDAKCDLCVQPSHVRRKSQFVATYVSPNVSQGEIILNIIMLVI